MDTPAKPKLRGWLHFGAAPAALLLGLTLLVFTDLRSMRAAVGIYVATTVLLFGVSAAYHLGAGSESTNRFLHRLDHANIYVFIAGTYTPFAIALSDGRTQMILIGLVWAIAAAGLLTRVIWTSAPRWLSTASYIALGWVAVFFLPDMWDDLGPAVVLLLALGGVLYTVGGVIYARKKPDPAPSWFGFHEIFHAFTIGAYLVHYAAVWLVV